jgi:hypothetical protein
VSLGQLDDRFKTLQNEELKCGLGRVYNQNGKRCICV